MKAAKSELAKRLLADPSVRAQIREDSTVVVLREVGRKVRYARVVVPKAA